MNNIFKNNNNKQDNKKSNQHLNQLHAFLLLAIEYVPVLHLTLLEGWRVIYHYWLEVVQVLALVLLCYHQILRVEQMHLFDEDHKHGVCCVAIVKRGAYSGKLLAS